MLNFNKFLLIDWLTLKPITLLFKEVRNDLWLSLYVKKRTIHFDDFIKKINHLTGSNFAIVVAFEQPWAIEWLLKMSNKNLIGTTLLVFDNSRNFALRNDIQKVCEANNTYYFSLPLNNTSHVNRSHGMAMSWIYENVIRLIEPKVFGFIDHDLIPFRQVSLSRRLNRKMFFGCIHSKSKDYWALWAGYCIFDYHFIKDKPINFLYDFSRGLDTGGRNWDPLYRHAEKANVLFASRGLRKLRTPINFKARDIEVIDDRWIHIGGIGYKGGVEEKLEFFKGLANAIELGAEVSLD